MSGTAAAEEKRKATDDDDVDTDHEGDDDSSSEEEEDLILEGVLVRNPDVSDEEDYETTSSEEEETPPVSRKKQKTSPRKKKKKPRTDVDTTLQVDFTFCDMDEKYFHGLKSLLHSSSAVYQPHSSALADAMIANVAVGTIVGTSQEDASEADVFGFASVLNVATNPTNPALEYLQRFCMEHCPAEHRAELDVCFSSGNKRPVGWFLHGRMINLPLEIVLTLHEQLILDLDWAVEHAEEEDRKSLDFGVFIRVAPCSKDHGSGGVLYKYFDDELWHGRAEFSYTVPIREEECVTIMVLTKTGHRAAMDDITKLIRGTS